MSKGKVSIVLPARSEQFLSRTVQDLLEQARGYAARHGTDLEAKGIVVQTDEWERAEAMALVDVALEGVAA